MRFSWDETKNKTLKNNPKRKLDFNDVKTIFNSSYYLDQKNDDPEQYRAIGFVGDKLITLIFEIREDEDGEYYHFVTYWPSTTTERIFYDKK